jgi:hypothetical protein
MPGQRGLSFFFQRFYEEKLEFSVVPLPPAHHGITQQL